MNNSLPFFKRKVFYITSSSLIVAAVAGYLFLNKSNSSNVYTVKAEDLTEEIRLTGTYKTAAETSVSTPANGIIKKLNVENGDIVKNNQKLFYVESTATQKEKTAALAAYQAAQSAYQEALNNRRSTQATVDNIHDQVKDHTGDETFAQKDIRTSAEVANDSAWDALRAAEAALQSAEVAYRETQSAWVLAPTAGSVANLQNEVGDSVSGEVLIIADYGQPRVTTSVNEVNIAKVALGESAKITFDALPGINFDGLITEVDDIGVKKQGEVNFGVKLSIGGSIDKLKSGMSANITLLTAKKSSIPVVPSSAIIKKNNKFYVQKQGEKNLTEVETGLVGLTKTEIVSGLSVGDQIIEQ